MARSKTRIAETAGLPRPGLPKGVVKSAGRTLQLLELFDDERRPLGMAEIADALDLPRSSVSGLLKSLALLDFVHCDPITRLYAPTARVALLGAWAGDSLLRSGALQQMIANITRRCGDTVVLATISGTQIRYLYVEEAGRPVTFKVPIGSTAPLLSFTTGYALLAACPDADVRKLLMRINAYDRASEDWVPLGDLMERLDAIRQRGYAVNEGPVVNGGVGVAVPLPVSYYGRAVVLAVCGFDHGLQMQIADVMQVVREEVDIYLAAPGEPPPGLGRRGLGCPARVETRAA